MGCGFWSNLLTKVRPVYKGWTEFAARNCACLKPLPVGAGVMLALRICLIWVLLCCCSGNSKSYTFIKGSRVFLFYSLDSNQREILRFLSTTFLILAENSYLLCREKFRTREQFFVLTLANKDQDVQEYFVHILSITLGFNPVLKNGENSTGNLKSGRIKPS